MPEIVKGHIVVILVGLVQEIPKRIYIYSELGTEIIVEIHLLEQQEQFLVFPGAGVESGGAQPLPDGIRNLSFTATRIFQIKD